MPSRRVLDLAIKVGITLEVAVRPRSVERLWQARSGGSGKVWRRQQRARSGGGSEV
jgi:hypothetical protein